MSFGSFLSHIAASFEHIVNDPVHAQAATAISNTLKATAAVVDAGIEPTQHPGVTAIRDHLANMLAAGSAILPGQWKILDELAVAVLRSPVPAEPPTPSPTEPAAPTS